MILHFSWDQFGRNGKTEIHSIFDGTQSNAVGPVEITLPAHGRAVYLLQAQ